MIKRKAHARNWKLFNQRIYKARLLRPTPDHFTLKLWLDIENTLSVHPEEIGARAELVVGDYVGWGDDLRIILFKLTSLKGSNCFGFHHACLIFMIP
jgi:hypothetical protein